MQRKDLLAKEEVGYLVVAGARNFDMDDLQATAISTVLR